MSANERPLVGTARCPSGMPNHATCHFKGFKPKHFVSVSNPASLFIWPQHHLNSLTSPGEIPFGVENVGLRSKDSLSNSHVSKRNRTELSHAPDGNKRAGLPETKLKTISFQLIIKAFTRHSTNAQAIKTETALLVQPSALGNCSENEIFG